MFVRTMIEMATVLNAIRAMNWIKLRNLVLGGLRNVRSIRINNASNANQAII